MARRLTRQEVLEAIRERRRRGLPLVGIQKFDRPLYAAARRHFDSWHGAVAAAGIASKIRRRWTKDRLVQAIRAYHAKGVPVQDIRKHDMGLYGSAAKHFGTWPNALQAAGLSACREQWNRQRVLDQIEARHRQGLPMTGARHWNPKLACAAYRHFGGWHNALVAAQVARLKRVWTRQEILEAIRVRHRQPLSGIRQRDESLYAAAKQHFGSWHQAVTAAGFEFKPRRRWTRQRLIEALRDCHAHGVPISRIRAHDAGLYTSACRHFGSWSNAIRAARLPRNRRRKRWSKQRVLNEIQAMHQKGLPMIGLAGRDPLLAAAANRYFGGLRQAIAAAGLTPHRRGWTRQQILDAIGRRDRRGLPLPLRGLRRLAPRLYDAVLRYFGDLDSALAAAGVASDQVSPEGARSPEWTGQEQPPSPELDSAPKEDP